ncbi:UNVERIFIED_ORG: hypothetical protein BTE55_04695 [Rhizobium sophorae]
MPQTIGSNRSSTGPRNIGTSLKRRTDLDRAKRLEAVAPTSTWFQFSTWLQFIVDGRKQLFLSKLR